MSFYFFTSIFYNSQYILQYSYHKIIKNIFINPCIKKTTKKKDKYVLFNNNDSNKNIFKNSKIILKYNSYQNYKK